MQGYRRTLLHQRRSEAAVRRCFTKQVPFKILEKSLLNKVAGLTRPHHKCFSMIFEKGLRTPYNKTPYTIKIAYG